MAATNSRGVAGKALRPPQSPPRFRGDMLQGGLCSGFALVELIAALFVLSAGIFGTITLYHAGMDRMRAQQQEQMAMSVLQYEMESVRTMDAADLDAWSNDETAPPGLELLENAEIERRVSARNGDLYEIQAVLRWRGVGGRLMERSLTTLAYGRENGP